MRSNRLRGWSPMVPLLVLVCLFGMHGLSAHTDPHPGTHPAGHASMADDVAIAADRGTPVLWSPTSGDLSGALAGCCVAVLLLGLITGLLRGRPLRRTRWAVPAQAWLPAPVPRSRAPDPPTPLLLSVCRC